MASATAIAQAPFQSSVDLVALDVSARGRDGLPAADLTADDFLVLENNVPQKVALFSSDGRLPLAVSLVIDSSQSMIGKRLERAKEAAAALIEMMRPGDLVEIMSFNDRVSLRYPLGDDRGTAKSRLGDIAAGGSTALYEAILVALGNAEQARLNREDDSRSVVIVLSDGENTAGHLTFDSVLDRVRRSNAIVYTVSLLTDEHDRLVAPSWEMTQLAVDSGGEAVAVREPENLTRVYQTILADLLHLYRIGYVPSSPARDGEWRHIKVRTMRQDVVTRTRSGYYATRRNPS